MLGACVLDLLKLKIKGNSKQVLVSFDQAKTVFLLLGAYCTQNSNSFSSNFLFSMFFEVKGRYLQIFCFFENENFAACARPNSAI